MSTKNSFNTNGMWTVITKEVTLAEVADLLPNHLQYRVLWQLLLLIFELEDITEDHRWRGKNRWRQLMIQWRKKLEFMYFMASLKNTHRATCVLCNLCIAHFCFQPVLTCPFLFRTQNSSFHSLIRSSKSELRTFFFKLPQFLFNVN